MMRKVGAQSAKRKKNV